MINFEPVADLRRRVADARLTMKDVCCRAGVAESTPTRWKNSEPNLATIRKLNVAVDELVAERALIEA